MACTLALLSVGGLHLALPTRRAQTGLFLWLWAFSSSQLFGPTTGVDALNKILGMS
jgi:hypothetical protein